MIKLFFKRKNCLTNNILCKLFKPLIYSLYRFIMWLYGSSIPLNSKFYDIPIFPHGLYGIFISGGAEIGKNVTIYQHLTIGSVYTENSKKRGAPKIGDNVVIGAGAKIVGGVTVGNNVKIGSNVVVFEDIPDNCTVVVDKPRIILNQ